MNPQQPSQDTDATPVPEQPNVGGEPMGVKVEVTQPVEAPVEPSAPPQPTVQAQPMPSMDAIKVEPSMPATPVSAPSADQSTMQPVPPAPDQPAIQQDIQPAVAPNVVVSTDSGSTPAQPQVSPTTSAEETGKKSILSKLSMKQGTGKNNKIVQFGVIGVAALVLLAAVVFGVSALRGGQLALETYEGDGYSVLVPTEYTQTEENNTVLFVEETDDDLSKSAVLVSAETSGTATQEEFDAFKKSLKDYDVEELIAGTQEDQDSKMTNITYDTTDTDGIFSYRGEADLEKDGEKVGKTYFLISLDKDYGLALVMIGAHSSDPALDKNAAKIIDSFEFQ